MVFEGLAEKLQAVFKKLKSKGTLTEEDVNTALREVRMALLAADVNLQVVKDFIGKVRERAVGQEVLASLTPSQQVVKIVYEELTNLMGGTQSKLNMASRPPTVIMLVGLQGAGKTTTAAKLGRLLARQGRRPLLVAADVYRAAAIRQLQILGEQLKIPVFTLGEQVNPIDIARGGVEKARQEGHDVVIIDTAGRLHINEEMMEELRRMKEAVQPHEILLVVDAMTGQDAVNVARAFKEQLGIDGVIMTKLDGDTRGGAALSVKAVTGCPIKFAGMGEKLDALEPFHPDRMASRILGMGDVLTLIEKAQAAFDAEQAEKLQKKILNEEFTLEDFLEQMQQLRNMGPLEQILSMIPGLGGKQLKELQKQIDEKKWIRMQAIIQSMTPEERRNPSIINGSRRRRIARGSGTSIQDVNMLLKEFEQARKMMKQLAEMEKKARKSGFKLPFFKG
ncbi:MAG: signal recognition particle subunit [Eubacteriales bacterium]|nr:signal recognition particle subunit [Eubacteriales bacterium]MDN5363487.1 signal recognition particle subunit [Eubacteriales bacterium]